MKSLKHILLYALLLVSIPCRAINYLLRLNLPETSKTTPKFCAFYKGYQLTFKGSTCALQEPEPRSSFTLIVAPEVIGTTHLALPEDTTARLFNLKKKKHEWLIEEQKPSSIIPDDAIVFLFDPEAISELTPDNESIQEKETIPLPTIELTGTEEELNKAAIAACCASLDIRALHRKKHES